MDGQRQYPADPDRWYADSIDEDSGRIPGQRSGDRYADQQRWDESQSRGEPARGDYGRGEQHARPEPPAYGEPTTYSDPNAYSEPAAYGDPGHRRDEPPYGEPAGDLPTRRRPVRPVRVGKRSGLEIPDTGYDQQPEEPPRYRTEALDRQALRREAPPAAGRPAYDQAAYDQPAYDQPSFDQPAFDQPGFEQGGFEQGGFDQPSDPSGFERARPDQSGVGRPPFERPTFDRPAGPLPTIEPSPPEIPNREAAGTVYPSRTPAGPIQAPTTAITPVGTTVYPAKRPALGMVIAIVAVVAELLLLPVLIRGELGHGASPEGVLGGLFGLIGIPLVGVGLHALACGAASTGGADQLRPWLRTPLAYLPIGLILLIAAGLAG